MCHAQEVREKARARAADIVRAERALWQYSLDRGVEPPEKTKHHSHVLPAPVPTAAETSPDAPMRPPSLLRRTSLGVKEAVNARLGGRISPRITQDHPGFGCQGRD